MALPSNPSLISADEYLNSSYRPDMEYVDGVLVERGMATIAHSFLQAIVIAYLAGFQKRFRFFPAPEVRTRIGERARYRLPEIALCPLPPPPGKVMTVPPWALSRFSRRTTISRVSWSVSGFGTGKRAAFPGRAGPRAARRSGGTPGALVETRFTELELPTGKIPFDTDAIFRELTGLLAGAAQE